MTDKHTLQKELEITEGIIRMYQMMLGSEYEEDFEHIELKYINNKGNEKSPEILGKIDSKNRNKLESIQINLGVQKYKWTQEIPPAKTVHGGVLKPSYSIISPIYKKNIGVEIDKRASILMMFSSIMGNEDACYHIGVVNKLICNNLSKTDSIQVPYRSKGRFKADTKRDKFFYRQGLLETFIFSMLFGGKFSAMDDCFQLCRFLRTIKERDGVDSNIHRYSKSTSSYQKLNPGIKSLFRVETITTSKDTLVTAYFINCDLTYALDKFLNVASLSLTDDTKDTFTITKSELLTMHTMSQIILLDRVHCIKGDQLYIKLYEKNEIAMCGRRYNTLNTIARVDRHKIELYGYDMESALQTILYSKFSNTLDLSWSKYYISNKRGVREDIANLFNLPIDTVKTEITAIYQGRWYNPEKYPMHQHVKVLFDEVEAIKTYLYSNYWKKSKDESEAYKYARKRTKDKYPDTTSKRNLKVTFLFFYWTYYERQIQDVMCKYISNSLPLHDAVYTQDSNLPSKEYLESQIKEETGISMRLGVDNTR